MPGGPHPNRLPQLAAVAALAAFAVPTAALADDGADFFETKVRPVLVEHCLGCHSAAAGKTKGGLALDTPAGVGKGGDSGPLFGGPDGASLLVQAVEYAADAPAMPPKGKLPEKVVADLRKWVALGAPLPAAAPTGGVNPAAQRTASAAARDFWAFRPAREHPAPAVADANWPSGKLDAFVLAKLDAERMAPAPPADRRTLARRLAFDVTGLPPTVEDVEGFIADARPDAVERLVDGLLASPRFGEKWGRHWLDVARYAEDNPTGEATNRPPRYPFRYRDWVIGAFNAGLPYNDFVRRQLAADLLPGLPPTELAALGFLGLSPVYHKEQKLSKEVIAEVVADEWDERVDAVTRGFLGLTVACARCHDHKFDPVSAEDYYALAGVMAGTQLTERPLRAEPDADALTATRAARVDAEAHLGYAKEQKSTALKAKQDPAPFSAAIRDLEAAVKRLREREKSLEAVGRGEWANAVRDAAGWVDGADPAWTVVSYRPGEGRDLPVFARGNPARPGPAPVPRRFLPVLSAGGAPKPFGPGSGRRELAEAIVTDAQGLAARVFVNRVWGWVFGRPLVTTPSNFGRLGDAPSHPELLDDLSARFVANGWSVKWLVRELVLSATYRQSSRHHDDYARRDADNKYLWRAPRKRLDIEAWRDGVLQVSGRLDPAGGGPSDNLDDPRAVRRTVYGRVSRQVLPDVYRLFDLPDPKSHGEKRDASTTPVQQLYFLNSPFVRRSAAALATREAGDGADDPDGVARAMYRRVLLRDPRPSELDAAVALVRTAAAGPPAWEVLAQVLLASNEFIFLL